MKTVTHYLKTLTLLCFLGFAGVAMAQPPCTPYFNYNIGSNGSVSFSGGAAGYSSVAPTGTFVWSYGNNGATSTSSVPVGNYTYPNNGTYTVTLLYINSAMNCSATTIQTIVINNANPCGLNSSFTWAQSSNGLTNFNNTSTGTNGGSIYSWDFGDGGTSANQSPTHTYASNGTYPVKLKILNSLSPLCVDSTIINVTISSYCNVNAGFSYTQNNNICNFTSTSTGAINYQWNFGDGFYGSGSNTGHNYASTGTYTVILTAMGGFSINPACIDTAVQVVTINSVCVANGSFSMSPSGTPQVWNAIPLSPANITAAEWYWGDGSTSNTLYTTHSYSAAGMYSICLSVTVSCGAVGGSCASYTIYRSSEDMNIITVNVINPLTVGINNQSVEELNYSISPNPNNGSFHLSLNGLGSGNVTISVYNLVGKLVYQSDNNSNHGVLAKDIQLNDAASGVYFIKVASDDKVTTKKVVIENNK
jgi:PKD repeat protein